MVITDQLWLLATACLSLALLVLPIRRTWHILLALVIVPIQTPLSFGGLMLSLDDIAVLVLGLKSIVSILSTFPRLPIAEALLALFVCLSAVSFFWSRSGDNQVSPIYAGRFLIALSVFWVGLDLGNRIVSARSLANLTMAGLCILAVLAILASHGIASQSSMDWFGGTAYWNEEAVRLRRARAPGWGTNGLGVALTLGCWLALFRLGKGMRSLRVKSFLVYVPIFLVCMYGSISTASRNSLFVLLLGLLVTVCSPSRPLSARLSWALFAVMLITSFGVFWNYHSVTGLESIWRRSDAFLEEPGWASASQVLDSRLSLWSIGVEIWLNNPIFGVGLGSDELANHPRNIGQLRTAHCTLLSVAFSMGFVGLLAGALIWLGLLAIGVRLISTRAGPEAADLQAFGVWIVGVVASTTFDDTIFFNLRLSLVLFFVVGIVLQVLKRYEHPKIPVVELKPWDGVPPGLPVKLTYHRARE